MEKSKRFNDLDSVHRHREELRKHRQERAMEVRAHWSTLGEPEFRSGVVNGTLRGIVKAWRPMDTLRSITLQPTDVAGTLLVMAMGSKARTAWGRLLIYAAGAAIPLLVQRLKDNERAKHLLSELEISWQRVKERMRERREARREGLS